MTIDAVIRPGRHDSSDRLVRALAATTFLLWAGASSILPLLPEYLKDRGASDGLVGIVMGSYFVGALALQYPAGRVADRFGRRPVLVGGLIFYAVGSFLFLAPVTPAVDIALRALQGAGAGAAEVASLAMVAASVDLGRRGRAFASIYGAQLAAMAIGPLAGSLVGHSKMSIVFAFAGSIAAAACLPAVFGGAFGRIKELARDGANGLPTLNRALVGSLFASGALGLVIGVYESCWTLLLEAHRAHDWQIGLSWTLFAIPFVAAARPGGWLVDHSDRRWLAIGSLVCSVGFCCIYPFVANLWVLLVLGGLEALGMAVGMPAAQSLLTQDSPEAELGRVQGLFSTSETAAIALAAGVGGALFGIARWAPFVAGGAGAGLLVACLPLIWGSVTGRAAHVGAARFESVADVPKVPQA
jgi:MFS family permease